MEAVEPDEKRIVRVTVTLERADGRKLTYAVAESDPTRPVVGEFGWSREPVDDIEAMVRAGWSYKMMKPGPLVDITLRATGAPVDAG